MNYDTDRLSMGLVSCSDSLDVHVLYNDMDCEMLLDLNDGNYIMPHGKEERYYRRSLIPFNEIVFKSKINFGHLNREDALNIAKYKEGYYFKLLRYRHIETIEDLENVRKFGIVKKL